MLQEQEKSQTPAILWVDRNIFSHENQFYCRQLEKDYPDCFFTINDECQYFEVVEQNKDKQLVILSSGECAYNLIQMTYSPIIMFCKNKKYHFDLFKSNTQIKAIVIGSFHEANLLSITCMNHFENLKNLKQLITPIQVAPSPQYQHSKYNISIKFFVVIEEIRKSSKITDVMLYEEVKDLLSKYMDPRQAVLRVENAISEVNDQQKKRKQKMKPYEKLLFLYSLENLQFYNILNQVFASYDYQYIKNILVLLLNGFKKVSKKQPCQDYKTLYRGISVKKNVLESIKQDLKESLQNQSSIFWNQLTSTSSDFNKALNFAFNDSFGILFKFELDFNNPHPYLEMPQNLTKFDENEILLFPQFEFVVQRMDQCDIYENILIVTIKQQKNSYAFALDKKLRNLYWQDVQNKQISPKVKSFVEFCFLRTDQLIQFLLERQPTILETEKLLKNEITNSLNEIQFQLQKILFNCKDSKDELIRNVNQMITLFRKEIRFENQSNSLTDYIGNFQAYFKSIKKALRANICSLLLKGMIDIQFSLEFLQSIGQRFQASKETPNLPKLNVNGQQINFSQFDNGSVQNTTGLTYSQLRIQKITSIQKVQNTNGTQAYEVTLKDGNKLLMHHNPNNNDLLMVSKQIDSQGKVGYTNKWKSVGEPQKIKHLTVEDVQSSIKGKEAKFDISNVSSIEMTAQMQQARITGQIGGAIATAAGSLAVDLLMDDFDGGKVGKAVAISAGVQGGLMYLQTVKSMAKAVPFVGIGLAATMTSISIGQVILSDFLKTSEKYYSALLVTIKTATSIGLGIAGVEGGMVVGASGGPIGVIIGGIIGGLLGGAGGNLLNRGLDLFTQFQIEFDFGVNNKSQVKNGFLVSAGCLPTIKWKNVKKKVKCMVLIAQSDKHMACIIPNIEPEKGQINHSDNMGVKLKGYRYIGPDDQCKEITFRLFAMMDEYVDENEILLCLKKNSLKLIDVAEKKIKF